MTADVYTGRAFCDVCNEEVGEFIYHCAAHNYDKCLKCV